MTQEEILEYNKRCALFLGATLKHNQGTANVTHYILNGESYLEHMLQFHSDWNWIMQVVEAIEKLGETSTRYGILIDITTTHIRIGKIVIDLKLNPMNKKEAAVQAINQFLIWYDKNK